VLLADHTLVTAAALERFMPEALGGAAPAGALPAPRRPATTAAPAAPTAAGAGLVRDYQSAGSHDAQALQDALTRHGGNQSRAAQSLGLTLRQFSYRLRKAGLR
jgi:Nif-specific regulatory protein